MSADATCQRCVELWRNYGTATREHVRLLKEQEAAARVNPARFRELDHLSELAAARRDAARAAITSHMANEHPADEPRVMTA